MAVRNVIVISVEDREYSLCLDDVPMMLIKECRAVVGVPPMVLVNRFRAGHGDLDYIAAVIWLCRRAAGEVVALETVEGTVTYRTAIDVKNRTEDTDAVPVGELSPEV